MNSLMKKILALSATLFLSACASVPNGPGVMALPGSSKNFDQFRMDDASCRHFALEQIGGVTANQAAESSVAKSAVVGTALGAALGAAAGGGEGAGIGAATGLLIGSLIGVDQGNRSAYGSQERYDSTYVQCMYARGHKVPVSGQLLNQQPPTYRAPSIRPRRYYPPPPPPDYDPYR